MKKYEGVDKVQVIQVTVRGKGLQPDMHVRGAQR